MPTEFKAGCVRPPSTVPALEAKENIIVAHEKEVSHMIKVGAPAPDFELAGYHQGSFKNFTLSELKGKWVVLCFYPGDFTFV